MSTRKMLTIVLSVLACIIFTESVASAQVRTVLVSPVPNDPVASGTALRNALAGISSPSTTNRWLLKIEPGIYQLQGDGLVMRPWVDIEGSGTGVTTIRLTAPTIPFSPTISGASNAELRLLTVETMGNAVAMFNSNANPRIYRVRFLAGSTQARAWGMQNVSSAPKIEECEFFVSLLPSPFGPTFAHGITFDSAASGARSSILRSRIMVSGASTNYGVQMIRSQTVTEIHDTRIDVVGWNVSASHTFGIYAAAGDWQGSESLELRNVIISSLGGASRSAGIWLESGTTVGLDIYNSKIWGHMSPIAQGIFQGGNIPIGVRYSSILGATKTVETVHNAGIAWTELIGGPVTGGPNSWVGCIAVADEFAVFYANGCPQ